MPVGPLLFHGFIAVAPLKPTCRAIDTPPAVLFHGFIAVAPLKRVAATGSAVCGPTPLPRLHRRGPIEAGFTVDCIGMANLLFHGFIAVAPLKRALVSLAKGRPALLFHGFIAVAPLKRSRQPPGRGSSSSSSTASSPWPH